MICKTCALEQPEDNFYPRDSEKYRKGKRRTTCNSCNREGQRRRYQSFRSNSYFKLRCLQIKRKSSEQGLSFNLTPEYLESLWTGVCPAFHIPIYTDRDRGDEHHAELDRIIPEQGYVKGNVIWLSRRANRIKNNASLEEIRKVYEWLSTH